MNLLWVNRYRMLDEEDAPQFTDVYWVRFSDIASSRTAKKKLDDYNFYGNLLDITYAPQHETVHDMRAKLEERRRIVAKKIAQSNFNVLIFVFLSSFIVCRLCGSSQRQEKEIPGSKTRTISSSYSFRACPASL